MADKIKEKAPIRKELKEKVKAAPKELLRRGLSDGTQSLRGQLRDTAQRGQRDDYGGDQIEDAAWRSGRWGERGIELDEMVELMVEAVCSRKETIRVAGNDFPVFVYDDIQLCLDDGVVCSKAARCFRFLILFAPYCYFHHG